MNRRDLFKGLSGVALLPVIGTQVKRPKGIVAYGGNALQCVKCLNVMKYSHYEPGQPVDVHCPNMDCSQYEIRYKAPMVWLQPVSDVTA